MIYAITFNISQHGDRVVHRVRPEIFLLQQLQTFFTGLQGGFKIRAVQGIEKRKAEFIRLYSSACNCVALLAVPASICGVHWWASEGAMMCQGTGAPKLTTNLITLDMGICQFARMQDGGADESRYAGRREPDTIN